MKWKIGSRLWHLWSRCDIYDPDWQRNRTGICWIWIKLITLMFKVSIVFNFMNDFLSDCPSLMHGIAIRYVQHCQAMLECGVCELAHFSFIPSVLKHWKHVVWSLDFDIYVRQDTFLAFAIKDVPLHTNLSKTRQHLLVLDRSNKISCILMSSVTCGNHYHHYKSEMQGIWISMLKVYSWFVASLKSSYLIMSINQTHWIIVMIRQGGFTKL